VCESIKYGVIGCISKKVKGLEMRVKIFLIDGQGVLGNAPISGGLCSFHERRWRVMLAWCVL